MGPMAAAAIDAIESGRVTFHPPVQNRVALDWLKNIRPWNVSRQLWWGHQLPIWYCPDGHVTCAETEPDACAECGSRELVRDEDVLDTWFSSALWPFATLGWPDDTPELRRYYPGDVNSTAREIIFLWEARMVMAGLELIGDIPFSDVIIHSTILAPDGRRMSKSLGTGIDPLELIAEYGADATRYGLLKMSSTQDVRFSAQPIEEGRKLANKLWNASRLLLDGRRDASAAARPSSVEERWILARIDATRAEVEARPRALRLRARGRPAVPPHVRRLLRLVPRGDQAAPAGSGRARDGVRRARAPAHAPASGDAARDGGDLVAVPRHAADRVAVARSRDVRR